MRKLSRLMVGLVAASVIWVGSTAKALSVPLSSNEVEKVMKGEVEELVVKFQAGDELPYTFSFGGDLVQTKDALAGHLIVQRDFFLKVTKQGDFLSFDGKEFRPYQDVLSGTLAFGVSADDKDHIASGINGSADFKLK